MKTVQLSKGYEAIVDEEYYKVINRFSWHARANGRGKHIYAYNNNRGSLHHYVYEYLAGNDAGVDFIDHINGNTLDNRLENLRAVTPAENSRNRSTGRESKYMGVTYRKMVNRWVAKTKVRGDFVHLGYFEKEEDAGMAYDRAVLYYHGDSDIVNFPDRKDEHDLSKPYERDIVPPKNLTGYRGVNVRYNKSGSVYTCVVRYGGRKIPTLYVGKYDTPEMAAHIYNEMYLFIHQTLGLEIDTRMLNDVSVEVDDEILQKATDKVVKDICKRDLGFAPTDCELSEWVIERDVWNFEKGQYNS